MLPTQLIPLKFPSCVKQLFACRFGQPPGVVSSHNRSSSIVDSAFAEVDSGYLMAPLPAPLSAREGHHSHVESTFSSSGARTARGDYILREQSPAAASDRRQKRRQSMLIQLRRLEQQVLTGSSCVALVSDEGQRKHNVRMNHSLLLC